MAARMSGRVGTLFGVEERESHSLSLSRPHGVWVRNGAHTGARLHPTHASIAHSRTRRRASGGCESECAGGEHESECGQLSGLLFFSLARTRQESSVERVRA